MMRLLARPKETVHCRIGSLENIAPSLSFDHNVHCRIGSLEIIERECDYDKRVHCRIGSLETQKERVSLNEISSLPYRQLRKIFNMGGAINTGSLPYRQLRKV